MARRGDRLHEHILWAAKDVFLEVGYERASMDEMASRAQTSKRSLYAHFESKDKLFLSFLELMRGNFLILLKTPGDYGENPEDALVQFCGRYLEILTGEISVRMCRVIMAEAETFSEECALHFHVGFSAVHDLLTAYLISAFRLTPEDSAEAAQTLLAQIIYPQFLRALFGIDAPRANISFEGLASDFDLEPVRKPVAKLIASLGGKSQAPQSS